MHRAQDLDPRGLRPTSTCSVDPRCRGRTQGATKKWRTSIDLLIDEIEKRDAIWNLNSKHYSDRIIKRRSWEELVLIFCDHGDSEEKKKKIGSILQKKWKNLRDTYVREI